MRLYKRSVAIVYGLQFNFVKEIGLILNDVGISTALLSKHSLDKEETLIKFNKGAASIAVDLDIEKSEGVKATIEQIFFQFSRIDYLINVSSQKLSDENNAQSIFSITKSVLPFIKNANNGAILNISTVPTTELSTHKGLEPIFAEAKKYGIKVSDIVLDKPDTLKQVMTQIMQTSEE